MNRHVVAFIVPCTLACLSVSALAQSPSSMPPAVQKVIFDTDIGDDIDDAFALGLLLSSPDVKILGVTTDYGDTKLRARLTARLLCEVGKLDIPVAAGIETPSKTPFSQAEWAGRYPDPALPYPDALEFILTSIRSNPGQITLISVSPFTNLGALIDRDADTFRELKRVVIMGGSIRRGYDDTKAGVGHTPDAEYNIAMDIPAAKKLFASGVPLYVTPLDSTQLNLDAAKRRAIFAQHKPLAVTLSQMYDQWTATTHMPTPVLYDAMAAAFALNPELCPTRPMHIAVDDKGFTRESPGVPNAQVCLESSSARFFDFYMSRLLAENLHPPASSPACTEPPAAARP
jgi:purine nucleosidase